MAIIWGCFYQNIVWFDESNFEIGNELFTSTSKHDEKTRKTIQMKKIILIYLLGLLIGTPAFSQHDEDIFEIRDKYNKWQPIIDKKLKDCEKFYNYAWGECYQYNKWFNENVDDDSLELSKIISIIKENYLGTYIHNDVYSLSGDWYITIDYYYDLNDKLYFVFWIMNTFHAEEPVTIEKRIYFDKTGNKIQELQSVFKMNTNEKSAAGFMDRDVDYKLDLKEMEFYKTGL